MFNNTEIGDILRYGKDEGPDKEGTIKHAAFTLESQGFAAMDSARVHNFTFNEAISFSVNCETQEEVDYFWGKLSEGGEGEEGPCGWLKDEYGLSWQINPIALGKMLADPDRAKAGRVMNAMLQMKKIDIERLTRAYEQQ